MSQPPADLDRLQRWMQSAITHPDGLEAGLEDAQTRAQLDVAADDVEQVLTRSRALPAADRLAVYARAYHARLLECLREEFAILRQCLGDEIFDAFALDYLRACPPSSYTLGDLGARFPRFLAENRPPKEHTSDLPDWADCLAELALLERTFGEVFDGPGVEGQALLNPTAFAAVPTQRWPMARLTPVPCLRLLALRFPVADYFTAVRNGDSPDLPEPADTFLAITRRRYAVRHVPLTPAEYTVLKALVEGATVLEAVEMASQQPEIDMEDLDSRLRDWFHGWARAGFFVAAEFAGEGEDKAE